MKIIYFSRSFTPHDYRFLQKISEAQHQVWFLQLEGEGLHNIRLLPPGVNLVKGIGKRGDAENPDAWLHLMPAFGAILEEISPDLIQAGPVQSCGFITAMSNFHPFLLMSWGSDILVDTERDPLWRWITIFALRHADILQCDCLAVKEKVETLLNFPSERIVQFPWGVDLERVTTGADKLGLKKRLEWETNFVILSARSWEPIYGIDTVLAAFSMAYAQNPRLRLILLGGGSLAPEISHFLDMHKLGQVVHRPGIIGEEHVPDYLRGADLYLSCSKSDGTSVSLLEAMATGLPAAVSDIPGNREWVRPGINGWLAPPGDAPAFAQKLLEAAGLNAAECRKIAEANRRTTEARADWHKNFPKLLEVYDLLHGQSFSRGA